MWRDGREDDGGGLENRYTFTGIVGSNPTPSASSSYKCGLGIVVINKEGRANTILVNKVSKLELATSSEIRPCLLLCLYKVA